MPLFSYTITIPANTTEANPLEKMMPIMRGVATRFIVQPRPGHIGLAHLKIKYHEFQIAPLTPDGDLHGDSAIIEWDDSIEIDQPAYELKLIGWNDDDTFPHGFDVYIAVLPEEAVPASLSSEALRKIVSSLSPVIRSE